MIHSFMGLNLFWGFLQTKAQGVHRVLLCKLHGAREHYIKYIDVRPH